MKTVDLALLGFGNVGKAFTRLLLEKYEELQRDYGFKPRIVGIATGSHGVYINQELILMSLSRQLTALNVWI